MKIQNTKEYAEQFRYTLFKMPEAYRFIRQYRLWEGFWKYGWITRFLIFIAVLLGLKFLSIAIRWIGRFSHSSNATEAISSMGMMAQEFFTDGFGFLFSGGMKYAMLVLLEVLVFHFSRQTLRILKGSSEAPTFDNFVKAQVRMIKIAAFSWAMELAFTIGFKIFFGIFSFVDFLQPAFIFAVQCYFLGFAILDNYHEQFELTIKESSRYARRYIGVAAATGLERRVAEVSSRTDGSGFRPGDVRNCRLAYTG